MKFVAVFGGLMPGNVRMRYMPEYRAEVEADTHIEALEHARIVDARAVVVPAVEGQESPMLRIEDWHNPNRRNGQ